MNTNRDERIDRIDEEDGDHATTGGAAAAGAVTGGIAAGAVGDSSDDRISRDELGDGPAEAMARETHPMPVREEQLSATVRDVR